MLKRHQPYVDLGIRRPPAQPSGPCLARIRRPSGRAPPAGGLSLVGANRAIGRLYHWMRVNPNDPMAVGWLHAWLPRLPGSQEGLSPRRWDRLRTNFGCLAEWKRWITPPQRSEGNSAWVGRGVSSAVLASAPRRAVDRGAGASDTLGVRRRGYRGIALHGRCACRPAPG